MKVSTERTVQETVEVDPMDGVRYRIYQGKTEKWYAHVCLTAGDDDLGLPDALHDQARNFFWWSLSHETREGVESKVAHRLSMIYERRVLRLMRDAVVGRSGDVHMATGAQTEQ